MDMESLLIDYIDGQLSEQAQQEVEAHLQQSAEWRKAYLELKTVMREMAHTPQQQPSRQLSQNFYQLLSEEQEKLTPEESPETKEAKVRPLLPKQMWQIAAAVALVVIGLGFGYLWQKNQQQQTTIGQLQREMQNTQKLLILNMLKQPSASERIKAVNITTEEGTTDYSIIKALIQTLETDESINVRVKAAEALGQIGYTKHIADALVRNLQLQESPEVQIAIIESLVNLQAKQALPNLQKLLKQDSIMQVVKDQAALGIEKLL